LYEVDGLPIFFIERRNWMLEINDHVCFIPLLHDYFEVLEQAFGVSVGDMTFMVASMHISIGVLSLINGHTCVSLRIIAKHGPSESGICPPQSKRK